MLVQTALFVSKRLQRVVLALICLGAAQLAGAVADRSEALPPGAVRVALKLP